MWAAVESPREWDSSTYLLHSIELHTRMNLWLKTKDGEKNRNKPEPLPTPSDRVQEREKIRLAEERARKFRRRQQLNQ